MDTRQGLEEKLAGLRAELEAVEGRPTEVYSRIVGYYRSVRNWNAGKRQEYRSRLAFGMPEASDAFPGEESHRVGGEPRSSAAALALCGDAPAHAGEAAGSGMLVFTRKACPNCPPVADYVTSSRLPAVFVDVDDEEGLALARRHGILSTPMVLGLDGQGREAFRALGLMELKARFPGAGTGA